MSIPKFSRDAVQELQSLCDPLKNFETILIVKQGAGDIVASVSRVGTD